MVIDDLVRDLPEQFKDKKRIYGLLDALARQMEEVSAVMRQLETMRSMNTATGKQLDNCGDIVALSRAESALYCSDVSFDVIDDERYRLFIKYKAMRNSTQCTYDQMIAGCKLLFDADPVYYREDDEHPASFALTLGVTDLSEDLLAIHPVPPPCRSYACRKLSDTEPECVPVGIGKTKKFPHKTRYPRLHPARPDGQVAGTDQRQP